MTFSMTAKLRFLTFSGVIYDKSLQYIFPFQVLCIIPFRYRCNCSGSYVDALFDFSFVKTLIIFFCHSF